MNIDTFKYVKAGGGNGKCLYCGSYDIVGGSYDPQEEAGLVCQQVRCSTCNKTWTDLYRLESVMVEV
jgi:transposase-like protein